MMGAHGVPNTTRCVGRERYLCVYVCVCVRERERERDKSEINIISLNNSPVPT